MKLVIALFLTCQAVTVLCFCGNRRQNTEIVRAVVKGLEWLKKQQKEDGSWGDIHTTGSALFTLRLAGMEPLNKTGAIEYLKTNLSCDNNKPRQIYPLGQLAYAIHGIHAMCHDPRDFAGKNWLQFLNEEIKSFPKKNFDNYFQYSLAVLVLCNHQMDIPLSVINQLIKEGQNKDGSFPLSDDVTAMSVMALECIHNTQSDVIAGKRSKIFDAMVKANRYLLKKKEEESLIKHGNQHTLALFVQAMLAAGKPGNTWKCSNVMKKLLSYQERDGSFGSLLANIQIIPALIGALPSDIKTLTCEEEETESETKQIKTCIKIDLGSIKQSPSQVEIMVSKGTTAYEGLVQAAKENSCYEFQAMKTTFGHMIKSICGVAEDKTNKYYWILHDGEKSADVGADQLELSEGKCAVFKYQKMEF